VTAILAATGLGPDLSRVPATALEAARTRGTAVHRLCEADHYGGVDPAEVTPEIAPYFDAYRKFLEETRCEPVVSEKEVCSLRWRYIGHLDRVAFLNGKRTLLDWKTAESLNLKPVALQLAGYRIAWGEMHPQQPIAVTAAVQLRRDGTYRLHQVDAQAVEHIFLAAVTVVHARGDVHGDDDARYAD